MRYSHKGSLWVMFGEIDSLGRVDILEVNECGQYTGRQETANIANLEPVL